MDQGRTSNWLFNIFCSSQSQMNPFMLCLVWPGIKGVLFVCLFALATKIPNTEFPFSKFMSSEN